MPLSQVKPENYAAILAEKVAEKQLLLAGLDLPEPQIFSSQPLHYRMRAEFRVWHEEVQLNYAMFRAGEPNTPLYINEFPIACEAITELMAPLRDYLAAEPTLRHKLFQIEFLSTSQREILVTLIYHRQLDEQWQTAAIKLKEHFGIHLIGRARKQKISLDQDFVTETLVINGRPWQYRQNEGSFTQPNAEVNTKMIEWAMSCSENSEGDLLELYCGNGNFTLPLATRYNKVLATEISKSSVAAAKTNMEVNHIDNITILRMSSEELTQAMNGEREFRRLRDIDLTDYSFSSVLVDPPRAGLDDGTIALVQGFERIIYISCNPETLRNNLLVLGESHEVKAFTYFDQFPYTHHMECGVLLCKRSAD
ncbi:MAG: tRNA (uridine(54)-C5)-methyltransferase TrmA [Pseudomonadales bacterium]